MKQINIVEAVRIYYSCIEIGNAEINAIFGAGQTKIARMKKEVRERMAQENVKPWRQNAVNTKLAFDVWGLDIAELENRLKKLEKIGFLTNSSLNQTERIGKGANR